MQEPVHTLPNLGPATARLLAQAGITSAEDLRRVGAVDAFARLRFQFGRGISLNALWAMDAALSGMDWRDLSAERKPELLHQLKTGSAPRSSARR